MKSPRITVALLLVLSTAAALAETVKDREGAVRQDRATMENDARWVYNNVRQAFAEARRTGKPLLVVLRCVPCISCSGIDAQVLLQSSDVTPLLDQFVCARIINANTLDLSLFQFDNDLSFSAMMFNGDGTIYGRYGSWTHQKNGQDTTTAGFKRALEAAMTLHRAYPANKAALAGKVGAPISYKAPIDIPGLSGKYTADLNWNGKVVPSCVHCHQIGDGLRLSLREKNESIPQDLIYPMPPPETIGLVLAVDQIARVESVTPGSIAARAGFQAGDDLLSLGGQPLVSVADVSWVLHRSPEAGSLAAVVKRGGTDRSLKLSLPAGWRSKSDISKRVGTWGMRGMATGGLSLEDLGDGARAERGLKPDALALLVRAVGQYGKHAAGKNAGFQKDDVIVAIDGASTRLTESELIGRLLARHQAGAKVPATVLRGQQRLELTLPMQ